MKWLQLDLQEVTDLWQDVIDEMNTLSETDTTKEYFRAVLLERLIFSKVVRWTVSSLSYDYFNK